MVIEVNGYEHFFPEQPVDQSRPLRLRLNDNHYTLLTDEEEIDVRSDGDCFYRAVLKGLTPEERFQLLEQQGFEPESPESVQRLRYLMARYASAHTETLSPLITLTESGDSVIHTKPENVNDILFSFIRDKHLHEAQEFKRKGYNCQIPEVDSTLIIQLREAVKAATSRLFIQKPVKDPLGSRWMIEQIHQIDIFSDWFSDENLQRWVNQEIVSKSGGKRDDNAVGSRKRAQSLVRRLESTLRSLMRVIDILLFINGHNTQEKRRNMLTTELCDVFSFRDKNSVLQAIGRVTEDAAGHAIWSSLIHAREATWESDKSAMVNSMIDTATREARKANQKARDLSGEAQTFFSNVAEYFQKLSQDLTAASMKVNPHASPYPTDKVKGGKEPTPVLQSDTFWQKARTEFKKGKLQLQTLAAKGEAQVHSLDRIIPYDYVTEKPQKKTEQIVADSIIRSILWQWQQSAIKIQYVSGMLKSKLKELKKIEEIFLLDAEVHDEEREQEASNISLINPDEHHLDAQVRQWMHESYEQSSPKKILSAKLTVLKKLLDSDIVAARKLLESMGKTKEDIQDMLKRQQNAILEMSDERHPDLAPSLKAVEDQLPNIATDLSESVVAINNAVQAAHVPTLAEAKKQADVALRLATLVRENISAVSSWLTERPLDEYSRSSRIAKHWAKIAREQNLSNYLSSNAKQVHSSLKKHGLMEGVVSDGDPEGYLFATRLATEFENARNDELRLPMSPEQYTALEKGLIEYIVKWGQRRLPGGIARTVIELSFEQALDAVTFEWSKVARLPYNILKASIKIPYKIHKVTNYIMPGDDMPYKAISDMLTKKLKQLGFNLIMVPVPGMLRFVLGVNVVEVAALFNACIETHENSLNAVYQRVTGGGKSRKIKMTSLKEMGLDFVIDGTFISASKGISGAGKVEGHHYNIAAAKGPSVEYPARVNEKVISQRQLYKDNQHDAGGLQDTSTQTADRSVVRRKREAQPKIPSRPEITPQANLQHDFFNVPADAKLHSNYFDFDRDLNYKDFNEGEKINTYVYGIKFILHKILNDYRFNENIKSYANTALAGGAVLVPVDLGGYRLNNKVLLPEKPGSKHGVLINLDSENPYYYVNENEFLLEGYEYAMPYNFNKRKATWVRDFTTGSVGKIKYSDSGLDLIRNIRYRVYSFDDYFNYNEPEAMSITSLAHELTTTMESDYRLKGETITNKRLISRAVAGAHIPEQLITAKNTLYPLEYTWAALTPGEYLRAFARPFSTFSKDIQLIHSSVNGETIQQTKLHAHHAEYIGHWFDASLGAATSFSPAGWVLNSAQSLAEITADCLEGKEPDPLAVANLILGAIPEASIVAKIGKFSRIGSESVKYGLMLGNKFIDLSITIRSIKAAVDSGDELTIYQAFLASGISVENSFRMAKAIVSRPKMSKKIVPKPYESTSKDLAQLEGSRRSDPQVLRGPSDRERESFDRVTQHTVNLNLRTRFILNRKFSGMKIESFDNNLAKFTENDDFDVAHISDADKKITKKISFDAQVASINDIEAKTAMLIEHLEKFRHPDKEAISANLQLIKSMIILVKENLNHPDKEFEHDIYVLVGKNKNPDDISNHYGLAEVKFSIVDKKITLNNLFAHPYVIVNKYRKFRDYLFIKEIISKSELDKYNIKNIARYLGGKAVRSEMSYFESFPKLKVQTFSFNGSNPVTQRLGHGLETISKMFSSTSLVNNSIYDEEDFIERRTDVDPYQEAVDSLKTQVRREFTAITPIKQESNEKTEEIIERLLNNEKAVIVSHDINESKNSSDIEINNFSNELIDSVDRSYDKVMSVKSLFERAESDPQLKAELKAALDEAIGLNDEIIVDIDRVDASEISDMAYERFKHHVNTLHDFLFTQKIKKYDSFALFKYHEPDSFKPDAFALPFDEKKRILVAIRPDDQRQGGLVDTVTHEASHVASYTLDHTYMGNIRTETGVFPSKFEPYVRDSKHFFKDDRLSKINTNYALGLPKDSAITEEQEKIANVLLLNSRLVKADALLNAAEYNAYMIDVLSRAKVNDSHIEFAASSSRSKRSVEYNYDAMVMTAALKVTMRDFKLHFAAVGIGNEADGSLKPVFKIRSGDTLKSIANNIYTDENMSAKFYQANSDKVSGIQVLEPGIKLTIPKHTYIRQPSKSNNFNKIVQNIPASVYTVQTGDTLKKIAKKLYYDENMYTKIYQENIDAIINLKIIHPGQILTIPFFTYIVQPGDTLDKISMNFYNDKSMVSKIFASNSHIKWFERDSSSQMMLSMRRKEVYPGQRLFINPFTYTVNPGDTLKSISKRIYSHELMVAVLYKSNKDEIDSVQVLDPGQKLSIPTS